MRRAFIPLLLLASSVAFLALPVSDCPAAAEESQVTIGTNPLDGPFLGFGAEWDSMAYRHFKMAPEDFALIRERLDWMRMPVVRSMMVANWCYLGDDRYDFDSPAMQMLYQQLDICQEQNISVILTDWGLNNSWLKAPGLSGVTDPKYAEVIAKYLDHLINVKKYSCIRTFIFMNEPEWMGYDKSTSMTPEQAREAWHTGLVNVREALKKNGLLEKIAIAGPDQSGNRYDWLEYMAQKFPGELDVYDIHLYANQLRQRETARQAADSGDIRSYLRGAWETVRRNDPDKSKPLILGEAGFAVFPPEVPKEKQFSGARNALDQDWNYGIYMTQYAIQAVEAGTWSVLAWMLDDSSHVNFSWGMWTDKGDGSRLKPWFYPWALLTRSFPANSQFSTLNALPRGVEGLAARLPGKGTDPSPGWSFVLVNSSEEPVSVRLALPEGVSQSMDRYLYAKEQAPVSEKGFPVPVETLAVASDSALSLQLPARSVTFLNPPPAPSPKQ